MSKEDKVKDKGMAARRDQQVMYLTAEVDKFAAKYAEAVAEGNNLKAENANLRKRIDLLTADLEAERRAKAMLRADLSRAMGYIDRVLEVERKDAPPQIAQGAQYVQKRHGPEIQDCHYYNNINACQDVGMSDGQMGRIGGRNRY